MIGLVNGCGPRGWWWIPDTIFGLHVAGDCDHHDFNYWIGCKEFDRLKADRQLHDEIVARAIKATASLWKRWLRPIYMAIARAYYAAAVAGGESSFFYGDQERTLEDLYNELDEAMFE